MRFATATVEIVAGVMIFLWSGYCLSDHSGIDHFAALFGLLAAAALVWRGVAVLRYEGDRRENGRGFEIKTVDDSHVTAKEADSARRDEDGPQR